MLRLANHSIPSAPPIKMGQYLEAYVEMPRSPEAKPLRSLCCKATVVWQRTDESGDMLLGLSVQQMAFRDLPRHFSQMATDLSQRSCVVM